ncbi:transcriptional regulator [Streptomyces avermitilis]|uniref:Regulatory protein n=2 Tax=Streptomyces avermitilis TaxID=33903 RepID=Q82AR2_STRAW|nr:MULTISPECIES: winged helix-turn-helix domain-containing protein [Streptomyces]KUN54445.1 transcriptional regulator [Streptomyces avermitilis]MYT01549.1 winged helix family transcriptional regulator [Streptomyces sp. SID5469]OOV28076.1 transcriptional regulator [Streptomyces avermitilis]BAC73706.1 putative regulatory protein [Streptomyces avermitilis MA-4680 = NBRC 14893]BBJ54197.1 transcriptional regulator [Streptomyces avermitilis]
MANTRSFSSVATVPSPAPSPGSARHRLRAVDRDEVVDVADFLPPGATWLPAPQHTLPTLPGQPPMIGYLVLVPADQQTVLPVAVPDQPEASDLTAGDGPLIRVDTVQRTAEVDGQPLDLTYLEFELLAHLVAHPHRVHTRDQLVTTVWGYGHVGDGRTVDVHIARLRRKLGADHRQTIQTVRRVGYKYTPPTGR